MKNLTDFYKTVETGVDPAETNWFSVLAMFNLPVIFL